MLYIVATPIGNMGDITYRAVEILKKSDIVFCEDTRRTGQLLKKYNINKPLKSYHKFCEQKKLGSIASLLESGQNVVYVSDSGTPIISDPGLVLVRECINRGLSYTSIPGPSSLVNAICLSGVVHANLLFIGFFPKKNKEIEQLIELIKKGINIIFYANPSKINMIITSLLDNKVYGNMIICREMTKMYEEIIRFELSDNTIIKELKLKGEITVIFESKCSDKSEYNEETLRYMAKLNTEYDVPLKDIVDLYRMITNKSSKNLYNELLNIK